VGIFGAIQKIRSPPSKNRGIPCPGFQVFPAEVFSRLLKNPVSGFERESYFFRE